MTPNSAEFFKLPSFKSGGCVKKIDITILFKLSSLGL